jgi:hypothetical protein
MPLFAIQNRVKETEIITTASATGIPSDRDFDFVENMSPTKLVKRVRNWRAIPTDEG